MKKNQKLNHYRVGDHLTVTISDMTRRGEGVGHVEGQALFVDGAVVGETVEAELTAVKQQYLKGKMSRILAYSENRKTPDCPAFPECGGCQCLHLTASCENELKRQTVINAFKHIGGLTDVAEKVRPTIGMERPCRYRNKAQLKVSDAGIGFYQKGSHAVVPIDDCMNQKRPLGPVMEVCQKWMTTLKLTPYDEKSRRGDVRGFLLRTNRQGDAMVVPVVSHELSSEQKRQTVQIFENLPQLKSLLLNIHTKPNNRVLGAKTELLAGKAFIEETLCGYTFNISPQSFFQVNTVQAERLYEKAKVYAALTGKETLWDLYCGTGTIGICMAKDAGQVLGVEIVPEAVADAHKNSMRNHVQNISFICGKAEDVMPEQIRQGSRADVAVVDPPRKGCARTLLDSLVACRIPKIVYVSCDPATLARDVGILTKAGYELIEATPVNMFPGTGHVETVALISR